MEWVSYIFIVKWFKVISRYLIDSQRTAEEALPLAKRQSPILSTFKPWIRNTAKTGRVEDLLTVQHHVLPCGWNGLFHSVICEKLCMALKLNGYSVQCRVGQWFGTQDVIDNLSGQG